MRYSIEKFISARQRRTSDHIVRLTFEEAYAALLDECPNDGDLRIHLSIDDGRVDRILTRHERHQLAADHGVDTWEDYRGEK